jgi:hypothetical protein
MEQAIKHDIARVVRTFDFGETDGGNCGFRAALGQAVLHRCGLHPGKHRLRDTLRFCLPLGGLL